MNLRLSKTTVSGYISGLFVVLAIVANCPSELQKEIMGVLPEKLRPYASIFFAGLFYLVNAYKSHHTMDVDPPKPPPA